MFGFFKRWVGNRIAEATAETAVQIAVSIKNADQSFVDEVIDSLSVVARNAEAFTRFQLHSVDIELLVVTPNVTAGLENYLLRLQDEKVGGTRTARATAACFWLCSVRAIASQHQKLIVSTATVWAILGMRASEEGEREVNRCLPATLKAITLLMVPRLKDASEDTQRQQRHSAGR